MNFIDYFLEGNRFRFIDAVREGPHPWSVLTRLSDIIGAFIGEADEIIPDDFAEHCRPEVIDLPDGGSEKSLFVMKSYVTPADICLKQLGVFIGAETLLEPGVMIKSPCVIGGRCEIRQGAYLRGGVVTGDGCVLGHVTEVKNSIFMDRSNAGHFAYVGDSVLGSGVNLGAGAKLANLQFRTREEIDTGSIKEIIISDGDEAVHTGLTKFGAVLGDYSEIGCNTVTSPGTLLGADCWVYPNTTIAKGRYGPASVIKSAGGVRTSRRTAARDR